MIKIFTKILKKINYTKCLKQEIANLQQELSILKNSINTSSASNKKTDDVIDLNKFRSKRDYAWYQDFLVLIIQVVQPKTYVELGLGDCELYNRISKMVDVCHGCDMNEEVIKTSVR